MTLLDQIRWAHAAKLRGGSDSKDGLVAAASLPAAEEIADRIMELDPDSDQATALEMGALVRGVMLDALEGELTGGNR